MYPIGDRVVRCYLYRGGGAAPRLSDLQQTQIQAASAPLADRSASVRTPARQPLVVVRQLSKSFEQRRGLLGRLRGRPAQPVQAVVDVDLELHRGEIVGLVGESGSGKTTLALTLLRLVSATSGDIRFDGVDVRTLGASGLRQLRRRMQMILQDPVGSLSPRLRVRTLLREPYEINRIPESDRTSVAELLELVGLSPDLGDKYPAQLSGGQARRVSIARALALEPELIIADEPTSGLDVSAAAGVLALMDDLRSALGITYLVITHDLNVVGQIADRLSVMYLGRIVESGPTEQIFEDPVHPYTQGLLAAVPRIHQEETAAEGQKVPRGEMPSPRTPPPGCRFHTRCRLRDDVCTIEVPEIEVVDPDHVVACHHWLEARTTRVPLRRRLQLTAD
jgi:oligopeptide/dipeptide ABC transporter ATP-binding protein